MLKLDDIDYWYRGGREAPIFSHFTWDIQDGENLILLGVNGAGKSTLLKLMSGVMTPRRGTITLNQTSRRGDLMSGVAWMPQQIYAIRGLSVIEQVAYAAWLSGVSLDQAHESAEHAVGLVNLKEKRHKKVSHLSGGQLRRVGLAEVLATQARILLLDEPTAGLDPAQRHHFHEILKSIRRDRALLSCRLTKRMNLTK